MSVVKVQGNASGTGIFTVAAPATNTDRTLTLPDQTGTVLTNAGPFTANASASAGAVTIDASNNVGMGAAPNERMMLASSGSASYIQICDSSTGTTSGDGLFLGSYNGAAELKTKENAALAFGTNNTERARIDASGNLLVGATSNTYGARVTSNIDNASWSYASNQTGSGTFYHMTFRVAGTGVGSIQSSSTTTSYNTSSDHRLKEDIAPMTGALAKVQALKPVTYKWKADGSDGQGFIAHELQEVVPDCVTGEKDAVETYTDDEGNEQTRPVYQGIDTSFLVATLTAAIQEQQALINDLTARIAALEAK